MYFLKKMFKKEESKEDLALKKVLDLYNNGLLTGWEEVRHSGDKEIWCIYNKIKILFDYVQTTHCVSCVLKIYLPNEKNSISICSGKVFNLFEKINKDIQNKKLDAFIDS